MAYNPLAFGLMLVGTGALIFGAYLYAHFKERIDERKEKTFGSIFMIIGIISTIFGFSVFFNTPIPGQYIEIYGVGYLLFGMLMIVSALCLLNDWDYRPASILAVIGGIILLGSAYTVWNFGLSRSPGSTTAIFALSGIGSLTTYMLTHLAGTKKQRTYLIIAIIAFVLVGVMALYGGMSAQFGHVASALAEAASH